MSQRTADEILDFISENKKRLNKQQINDLSDLTEQADIFAKAYQWGWFLIKTNDPNAPITRLVQCYNKTVDFAEFHGFGDGQVIDFACDKTLAGLPMPKLSSLNIATPNVGSQATTKDYVDNLLIPPAPVAPVVSNNEGDEEAVTTFNVEEPVEFKPVKKTKLLKSKK